MKIFITGPPGSGKSFYGKQLAENYNVPHIHVAKLVEEVENWNREKEGYIYKKREAKRLIEEEKEREIAELKRIEEELKKQEEDKRKAERGDEPADED